MIAVMDVVVWKRYKCVLLKRYWTFSMCIFARFWLFFFACLMFDFAYMFYELFVVLIYVWVRLIENLVAVYCCV